LFKHLEKPGEVASQFKIIMDWIYYGLKHEYYRINIECSNATFFLIKLLRLGLDSKEQTTYALNLYNALVIKFKANDVDQELKFAIISTVGNLLYHLGHTMDPKPVETILDIYIEK
jgi:hypothetical protein